MKRTSSKVKLAGTTNSSRYNPLRSEGTLDVYELEKSGIKWEIALRKMATNTLTWH